MTSRYITERPIFLSIIREIEGKLYRKNAKYIKGKTLDFGCGDGFFAKEFISHPSIIGFDIETKVKSQARSSGIYTKVIIGNGKKLPFKDKSFDTVISNCVLEHVANLEENLAEISRVLKPGGFFLGTMMEIHWDTYLMGYKFFGSLYSKWMRHKQIHRQLYTIQEWKAKFTQAGLVTINSQIYLNRRLSRLIDIFHYLGIIDLIVLKLTDKWILFPSLRKLFPLDKLVKWGEKDIQHPGGAVFLICRKRTLPTHHR